MVLHEAAHIFHNCKREHVGLPSMVRREWLLDIDFTKRETFAYTCEALGRILGFGRTRRDRELLLEEYASSAMPGDHRVEVDELVDILREAVGWRRIHRRCAPSRRARA